MTSRLRFAVFVVSILLFPLGASAQCDPDLDPPVFNASATASPSVLWPPNHKMVDISFSYLAVDPNACDPNLDCIISVTSDEPENGLGDGDTSPDWEVDQALGAVRLRAERAGNGNGRVYTITVTCVDDAGNQSSSSAEVVVPHDQRKSE